MNKFALIAIGKIVGFFGVNGGVKVVPYGESLRNKMKSRQVYIGVSSDDAVPYTIEKITQQNRHVVIKFKGIDDRTSVEQYKQQLLFLEERFVKRPEKGKYFVYEIIGCEVVTAEGNVLGKIDKVYKQSGHDIWSVNKGKTSFLLPVVKEFVKKVDVAQKKITVQLIEGLDE